MSIFDVVRFKETWFDGNGLLKRQEDSATKASGRPRRKLKFGAVVVASLIGVSATTIAANPLGQVNVLWPTGATEASKRQVLVDSIRAIRRLKANWNGHVAAAPVERSASVAEYVIPQIANFGTDVSAGVDGDGNVFFKFSQGHRVALLTVEPRQMHLVYMEPGKENVYRDDESFNGKVLPARIKRVLDEHLKS